MSKYSVGGSQTLYQPESDNRVLTNKLNITEPADMDDAELQLLVQVYQRVLTDTLPQGPLTTADLKQWHRLWLSPIYQWAGEERSVNMAKGDFHFAAAAQIPRLLEVLDRGYLAKWTPCTDLDDDALIEAIATVHVEFILSEGNGRLSRLLADVMAAQAGCGTLDYSSWDVNRNGYFAAIQTGLAGDYRPMMDWVERALNVEG